jgi:hypothetical protein
MKRRSDKITSTTTQAYIIFNRGTQWQEEDPRYQNDLIIKLLCTIARELDSLGGSIREIKSILRKNK